MIHAYTWPTPNGKKLHIMLEECGLDYEVHPVSIRQGDQHKDSFLAIGPNNKIPAIVDTDGPGGQEINLFESGAILIYLARKSGKFLADEAAEPANYFATLKWLMWQMGGVGPMLGQAGHFLHSAPEGQTYAIERFTGELKRLYGVAEKRLADVDYLAGGDFSIADIASYPWMVNTPRYNVNLDELPNVRRWLAAVGERPGVQRGLAVLAPPKT